MHDEQPRLSMSRKPVVSALGRAVAAVFVLLSLSAAAQEELVPNVASEEDSRAEAGLRFQRGYSLAQKGDYAGAATEFERAYELRPNASVLYNLGQAYAASGKPVRALKNLQRSLKGTLPAGLRAKAQEALSVVQHRVGFVRLQIKPEESAAWLDGTRLTSLELAEGLSVATGTHMVVTRLAGYETELSIVEVVTGEESVVSILLHEPLVPGFLDIRCAVPEVSVYVDGMLVDGQSRSVNSRGIASLSLGRHTVRFERPGYVTKSYAFAIKSEQLEVVDCDLEFALSSPASATGMLNLAIYPLAIDNEATVFSDGMPLARESRRHGGNGLQVRLPVGVHHLQVTAPHRRVVSKTVVIHSEKLLELELLLPFTSQRTMQIADNDHRRLTRNVVIAGSGLVLGAIAGVLGFTARHRLSAWQQEAVLLNGLSAGEPSASERLRANHQRARGIERLNDAAVGFGISSGVALGVAGALQWLDWGWESPQFDVSAREVHVKYEGTL